MTVTAAAGLNLGDLVDFFIENGVEMPNLPSPVNPTIGGAFSTDTTVGNAKRKGQ